MNAHFLLNFKQDNLEWDYMGFGLNRRFNPCLRIKDPDCGKTYIFEGYNILWNLLDTACHKETLPRNHFNDVLKHRFTETGETALEIIKGVLLEGDETIVIVQGQIEENLFIVQIIHRPWGHLTYPALDEISKIMLSDDAIEKAYALFWEPYTLHIKNRDHSSYRAKTVPSIIGAWRLENNLLFIRVLMVENTQSFVFLPFLQAGENTHAHITHPMRCPTTSDYGEIYSILKSMHSDFVEVSPLLNHETPLFTNKGFDYTSTLAKYKKNTRIMRNWFISR